MGLIPKAAAAGSFRVVGLEPSAKPIGEGNLHPPASLTQTNTAPRRKRGRLALGVL